MADFAGKVALVTGARSGIGMASAVLLASRGAAVGVLADNAGEIDETAREIAQAGGRALPLCADVSDAAAMRDAVDRLVSEYGWLDVVFANAGKTAYSATKAAQVAMMRVLALELAPHGIRVNAVCPGWIDTQIDDNTWPRNLERAEYPASFPRGEIPLTGGRPGSSFDVAELVAFLASDRARHITGSPVWIDAGESILV